jgi:hypothetical protein
MTKLSIPVPSPTSQRQLSMSLDSVKLRGMSPSERAATIAQLANLLMEAGGVAVVERDHDGR